MKNLYAPLLIAVLQLAALVIAQSQPVSRNVEDSSPTANVVTEDEYDVNFYFLDLDIEASGSTISGNVMVQAKVVTANMDTMALELSGFTVDSAKVALNGGVFQKATVARTGTVLEILLPVTAKLNDAIQTRVYYHGTAATSDNYPDGAAYFIGSTAFSASPPYNSDTWWPCKQNLTDKADSSWFFITTNLSNTAVSNGYLSDTVLVNGKRQWQWKTNYPINFYLISFTVGPLSKTVQYFHGPDRTDSMPVVFYGLSAGNEVDILTRYSEKFGLYPFYKEKLGLAEVNLGGGMENQTIICLGIGGVQAHETMHQWFGDNVSVGSFRDLALSEGFARWAEALYPELTSGNPNSSRISSMNDYESTVLEYPTGSVYNYSSDTSSIEGLYADEGYDMYYTKGAMFINTMRGEINNDSLFFMGLTNYQTQLGGKTALGTDLRNIMQTSTGVGLTDLFADFYYGLGFPTYAINWNQKNGRLEMQVIETTSDQAQTPLFKSYLEIEVEHTIGSTTLDTILRIYIDKDTNDFNLPLGGLVNGLVIDPNQWIANDVGAITLTTSLNIPCTLGVTEQIQQHADTLLAPQLNSYQWYFNGTSLGGDTLQALVVTQSGLYWAQVADINGCTGVTDTINTAAVTGISSVRGAALEIYPNPANNQLIVQTQNFTPATITIYNVGGREISKQPYTPQIDISALIPGTYFIEVSGAGNSVRKQVVKL